MNQSRRDFLALTAGTVLAGTVWAADAEAAKKPHTGLGIVLYSYAIRSRAEKANGFAEPLKFLEFCRERGAGGVQLPLGVLDEGAAKKLQDRLDSHGMFLEGSLRTPRDSSDVDRFAEELRSARAGGATVVRTVMLGGRRYESLNKLEEFRAFQKQALVSLRLAEPILAKHKMHLAVENHKDFRANELAAIMRQLASEWVGVCIDTGNNLALLEDALTTIETLAPWAVCCHLKDMGVEEHADGFLLSEVPLGEGLLDLKKIVTLLRKARPSSRFSLEMITRDPLSIPCLTDKYWTTLGNVSGRDLARTLSWVRKSARKERLPRLSTMAPAAQLELEDRNVRRSLDFAREKLGL